MYLLAYLGAGSFLSLITMLEIAFICNSLDRSTFWMYSWKVRSFCYKNLMFAQGLFSRRSMNFSTTCLFLELFVFRHDISTCSSVVILRYRKYLSTFVMTEKWMILVKVAYMNGTCFKWIYSLQLSFVMQNMPLHDFVVYSKCFWTPIQNFRGKRNVCKLT